MSRRPEAALTPEEVAAVLAVVEARVAEEAAASGSPSVALAAWAAAGRPGPEPHRRQPAPPSVDPAS